MPERIGEVVDFLENHYAERCNLRTMAVMAGISRFYFLRQFRAATGASPHQYVIALRLNAAASRLRSTTDPITSIAFDVGFNDLSNFNLLFRRSFGVTPRQWRMQRH